MANGPIDRSHQSTPGSERGESGAVWIGSNDLWYLYEYGNPIAEEEAQDVQTFTTNLNTIFSQLYAGGATLLIAPLDYQSQRPVVADPPNPNEPAFPGIAATERQRATLPGRGDRLVLFTVMKSPLPGRRCHLPVTEMPKT